ncbi:MAG: NAD-dependent dehydratase [Waddliaceae bacterium]|nr:NAD-dependent dehydratase [Waddliaceae bacterium]
MSKIALVTGGAGFIGSHLVEALLEQGISVRVLDDLAGGKKEHLKSALQSSLCTFHQVDISNYSVLAPHFTDVDWVFHLAALADIVPSIQNPLRYCQANVQGTSSVVEAARQAGVKRFVYTASSSCYGLATILPTPESASIHPMYPYAFSKYQGEQIVMHWNQVYGLPAVSLRLFNVYGPRARTSGNYGAVFGVFLRQLLEGKPLTVVGDGKQTRDFTFVSDVVNALILAAQSDLDGEIMNVGSGGTYSVNELVDLLGADSISIPKRPGEPDCTFADTTRIRQLLGWKPKVSFSEGVSIMKNCIEDWREAPLWDVDSIAKATEDWFSYLS